MTEKTENIILYTNSNNNIKMNNCTDIGGNIIDIVTIKKTTEKIKLDIAKKIDIGDKINQQYNNNNQQVKFIDLFCGIGSFHYSFKKMGWKCVMASDINSAACTNYNINHNLKPLGDICNIQPKDIPNYDILCAGFPCQPFSQAGKHKGFNDERGTMFSQVMKFVKYHKPKIIILENVQALLNHDDGKSFKKIKTDMEKEKYNVIHKVLNCSDYGIPQMRKRLFIVGVKKDVKIKTDIDKFFNLDKYKKSITLSKYLNKKFAKNVAYTIRCGGKSSPINDRHNWDGYIVDGKEYRLTINDALKLQGYDDEFKLIGNDSNKWKLLGNTIPTIFTEIIGKQLYELIFST